MNFKRNPSNGSYCEQDKKGHVDGYIPLMSFFNYQVGQLK